MNDAERIDFHGLPAVRLRGEAGASAIVTLQGAHVVSWTPVDGDERLFLSERSTFAEGRAIRGGIPVVFPQFADRGPLAQHGFARTAAWTFDGTTRTGQGIRATFALQESPETLKLWPHAFRLVLAVGLGIERLDLALHVANTAREEFTFTCALHTYLRIADGSKAHLEGLQGLHYLNRGEKDRDVEAREAIPAGDAIDRIYFEAAQRTRLVQGDRALALVQSGFVDTVVWNPGAERVAQMADMLPDGDRHMLCVEAAAIEPPIVLQPGATWTGVQSLVARD